MKDAETLKPNQAIFHTTKSVAASQVESAKNTCLRVGIYTSVIFALMASLPLLAKDMNLIAEHGPIENIQFVLIAAAAAIFIFDAVAISRFSELSALLAVFAGIASIRELDAFFDRLIPLGWQLPASMVLLTGVTLAWRMRRQLKKQIPQFLISRSFGILWVGFIVVVPLSQLLGHGHLLQLVMGDDYNRDYKRFIEETGEFIGYTLLLFGSMEFMIQTRKA